MTKLTKEAFLHIADHARLNLTEEELEGFRADVNNILEFSNKLKEINTDGVKATIAGNPIDNVVREDAAKQWQKTEQALNNAPEQEDGHFKVPAIMD